MEIKEEGITEAKQVITNLALGLLRQDLQIQKGTAGPVTVLEPYLQWGWDKLALLCLKYGVNPPRHLPDLVRWLNQPTDSWDGLGPLFAKAELCGTLLIYGAPSELCSQLGREMQFASDPERELHDLPFKEILSYCQTQHLPEQYTKARRFLVENPYLPHSTIVISAQAEFDEPIRNWLSKAYEGVPMICRQEKDHQELIARCPRCGWVLEWRGHDRPNCYSELCGRVISQLGDSSTWEPVSREAMRTTRGIQSSIVGPEVALLQIYQQLTNDFGLRCELWPEVDSYDLRIEFPDGEYWAVDLKDTLSPNGLAVQVTPFRSTPSWDKAFFVFPEHRRQPDYLRTFLANWIRPGDTSAMFMKDFVQLVQEKVG